MSKKNYKLKGLDCPSCAAFLESDLEEAGIKCKCSYTKETLEIEEGYDTKKVEEVIKKSGYNILS